jgi:hypothetical protein
MNYVYIVRIKGKEKPIPTVSKKRLEEMKSELDKYLKRK